MKKSTLLLFVHCIVVSVAAQFYDVPVKAQTDSFARIYFSVKPSEQSIPKLYTVVKNYFRADNKAFTDAYEELRKKYRLPGDSATQILIDSVISNFLREYLWVKHLSLKEKSNDYLTNYASLICDCSTSKIKRSTREAAGIIDSCIKTLTNRPNFYVKSKEFVSKLTPDEQTTISNLVPLFLMNECKMVGEYYKEVLYTEAGWEFVNEHERILREKAEEVVDLYNKKSNQLANSFPAYKQYELAIKQATAVLKKNNLLEQTEILTLENKFTVFRTYYAYVNEKAVLFGQVSYTLKEESIYAPVTSFKFITSDKIPMKESIVKWLNSMYVEPPPPLLLK